MDKDKEPRTQYTQEAIEDKGPMIPLYYGKEHIPTNFKEVLRNVDRAVKGDLEALRESEDFKTLESLFPDSSQWLDENKDKAMYALLVCFTICDAAELIRSVYFERQGGKRSLFDFTDDRSGKSKMSEFFNHIDERDGALIYLDNTEAESVRAVKPKKTIFPLDRFNDKFWTRKDRSTNGKMELTVLTKPGHPSNPSIFSWVDFTEVLKEHPEIDAHFDLYDQRVCMAVGSLYKAGNRIITIDQIYYAMGGRSIPSKAIREKIDTSLNKFAARFHMDNKSEGKAKLKYKKFVYEGNFIHFDRVSGVKVNGKEPDIAIIIYDYPAILKFAEDRKQIADLPIGILQTDIKQTEFTMKIENYLIERISAAKSGYEPSSIKLSTMYENCEAGDRQKKRYLREYAKRFLDHYISENWIKGYTLTDEKIIIKL